MWCRAAAASGFRTLGLEGFLVDDGAVYPALSRIADASGQTADDAARWLVGLLEGPWADPPTAGDQLHSDASGRHMVVVVIDEATQDGRVHLFERDGEWVAECLLCEEWVATGPDRRTIAERFGRHLQHDPPHAARCVARRRR